jgi:hypothetical protein
MIYFSVKSLKKSVEKFDKIVGKVFNDGFYAFPTLSVG